MFLPLLKMILELCILWSVTDLEFQGHFDNNSLLVEKASTTLATSSRQDGGQQPFFANMV
jgi:hypothetical protein